MVADLDTVLTIQILVAWAGESGDPPRLGWWRTDMASEYGGEDLFRRLLPNTWRWATLQAAREAARRTDEQSRREAHDADALVSLFALGVDVDRRLDERLQDLVRTGQRPADALPGLAEWIGQPFDRDAFGAWLRQFGEPASVAAPSGRRLKGAPPEDIATAARSLASALLPLGSGYPLPHYRRGT